MHSFYLNNYMLYFHKKGIVMWLNILIVIFLLLIVLYAYRNGKRNRLLDRLDYIDSYYFPQRVRDNIIKKYPHLSTDDVEAVLEGLKEYFKVATIANGKFISMPSKVIDVAWHEFLLFTKQYEIFCKNAFGYFFHHHPSEGLDNPDKELNKGVILCWKIACKLEDIDPNNPSKLPLIFTIDKNLKIKDGFQYTFQAIDTLKSNISEASCGGGACGGGTISDTKSILTQIKQ